MEEVYFKRHLYPAGAETQLGRNFVGFRSFLDPYSSCSFAVRLKHDRWYPRLFRWLFIGNLRFRELKDILKHFNSMSWGMYAFWVSWKGCIKNLKKDEAINHLQRYCELVLTLKIRFLALKMPVPLPMALDRVVSLTCISSNFGILVLILRICAPISRNFCQVHLKWILEYDHFSALFTVEFVGTCLLWLYFGINYFSLSWRV